MNVKDFMSLPDVEKSKYFVRLEDDNELDIKVFTAKQLQFTDINTPHCDICDSLESKYIGTSDTREPKYCFFHYEEINQTSDFVKY